jgi:hypothetical protein
MPQERCWIRGQVPSIRGVVWTAAIIASMVLPNISVVAQNYRGEAVQIAVRAEPVEFSRLRFLRFVFGREGPMDAPLPSFPVSGHEYLVEADVFGIESAADIRFELLDADANLLQIVPMWKATDSQTDGEFHGFVTVPGHPFRFAVSGTTWTGGRFRSVLDRIFQPLSTGASDEVALPDGLSPAQAARIHAMLSDYRRQMQLQASRAAAAHPDGVIRLDRVGVSAIQYEPLNSASGSPIGMRLTYSMRFPDNRTVVAVPSVFPVYSNTSWRGVVSMKPIGGSISPAPPMGGVQSLQEGIVYKAPATYQGGVTYTFRVDLVPDYVDRDRQTGRFCIRENSSNRAAWDAIMASADATPFTISISDSHTTARVPAFLPQRTIRDSLVAEGVVACRAAR